MSNFSYSKDFQGVADVFLRTPALYRPLLEFIEKVMMGPSELSKAEREIIAAHISRLNDCDFCLNAHRATLAAMKADSAIIDTLENGVSMAGVSEKLRAILAFAERLTLSPGTIGKKDIDALKRSGVAEQTIEDAINVIALFNYVNRLVDSFGVEGSPDYFDYVGGALASQGYVQLLQQTERQVG